MVLIRTIIFKLILTICLTSSLDFINLKINNYTASSTDVVWLTENQPFYFHIESDMELRDDLWFLCPKRRYFKLELIFNLTNYEYYFTSHMNASQDMNGQWSCYVYNKRKFNPSYITIRMDVRVDVDECEVSHIWPCSTNASCTNTHGSYECTCLSGYTGNGTYCQDVNECKVIPSPCSTNASCTNTHGSYECTCLSGYTGNGTYCQDVDECDVSHIWPCSTYASCTNTHGSYECTCLSGYAGNGTYCQILASDGKHTWILVVIIVVVLIVVAAVVWFMVDLYKRRQRREKAIQSELNFESFENITGRPMPPPAQWDNCMLPVDRQNDNDTDNYSVPYHERNVEEMYSKPLPKSLRKLSNELLYAELSFSNVEQIGENSTKGNLSNQTVEYSQIQPKKLIGNPDTPKILPTERPYSEVLPKSIRPNNESSKYVNVFEIQNYVYSHNGEASQERSEYAEPAYSEISLKK